MKIVVKKQPKFFEKPAKFSPKTAVFVLLLSELLADMNFPIK